MNALPSPVKCLYFDGSGFCDEPAVARSIRCSRHYGVPSKLITDPFLRACYDAWARERLDEARTVYSQSSWRAPC